MPVETMTIHLALSELKLLESRILKKLREGGPYAIPNKHNNDKHNGESIDTYVKNTQSAYQSVRALCERRTALKRAIAMSNAVTTVEICGKTYTVAEAIEMKNHGIPMQRQILQTLVDSYTLAQNTCNRANGDVLEERADAHIRNMYGNTDMKSLTAEAKATREEFIKQQTMEVVDPIGIKAEIERLDKEISDFLTHVDAALSVSNAVTNISIGDADAE